MKTFLSVVGALACFGGFLALLALMQVRYELRSKRRVANEAVNEQGTRRDRATGPTSNEEPPWQAAQQENQNARQGYQGAIVGAVAAYAAVPDPEPQSEFAIPEFRALVKIQRNSDPTTALAEAALLIARLKLAVRLILKSDLPLSREQRAELQGLLA